MLEGLKRLIFNTDIAKKGNWRRSSCQKKRRNRNQNR